MKKKTSVNQRVVKGKAEAIIDRIQKLPHSHIWWQSTPCVILVQSS